MKTIQGYVRAAVKLATAAGGDDPRYLSRRLDRHGNAPTPTSWHRYSTQQKKNTPFKQAECLPVAVRIIAVIGAAVSSASGGELRLSALIRDAVIIATFTGSRVAEYAQASKPAGVPYMTVPINAASGKHGGEAIAFTRADFSFYSDGRVELLTLS